MKPDIDIEKIREKLEKAWNSSPDNFVGEGTDFDKWPKYTGFLRSQIHQVLSLLPKPCSECGGSGEKTIEIRFISCSAGTDTKTKKTIPCPACQAPASEIEEFVEEARLFLPPKEVFDNISITDMSEQPGQIELLLHKALDHLATQAKRVEELEIESKNRLDWCAEWESEHHSLRAKVERLEELKEYTRHKSECNPKPWENICNCGYLQLLRKLSNV